MFLENMFAIPRHTYVSNMDTLSQIMARVPFWPFFKKIKESEKILKKWNPLAWSLLCVLVARENDKLEFWQNFHKTSSQKGQSSINMYKFRVKWRRYYHPHAIVCDNVSIFDT